LRKLKIAIHKLLHWEYWSVNYVYFPIYFYWIYLSIKARSLSFFNASNPTIQNGGFAMESKNLIYNLIPKQYIPKTLFFEANQTLQNLQEAIQNANITFPFIVKPDIGLQGLRVEKIKSWQDLEHYLEKVNYDFLVQEFVPLPQEIGLFYIKYPDQEKGFISGIVYKEFLIVTGDGKSSIRQLIENNPRYLLQIFTLETKFGTQLNNILPLGEKLNLVPFGNHVRGCKFIDVSHWVNDKLTNTFNEICTQIPNFYYGRLDIMFQSQEDLENGKNFTIIELNGAGSEPTHIYDPTHSIFFAWKEIIKHYNILYKISTFNHKKGHPYLSFKEAIKLISDTKKVKQNLKNIS
jgi:hypothetical protein